MKGRLVGLDYGVKRIGIALSDSDQQIAFPYGALTTGRRMKETIQQLNKLLQEIEQEKGEPIVAVIIGLPLMMNGQQGLQADEVELFAQELAPLLQKPVTLWDERLTSVQADRVLRESNLNRKQRSQKVDGVAATLILQSYLDAERNGRDSDCSP